jgi:hypothetical protein
MTTSERLRKELLVLRDEFVTAQDFPRAMTCRESADVLASDDWLPIETAPSEGIVLIYCPQNSPGERIWMSEAGQGRWTIFMDGQLAGEPTHWQPLPKEPTP